MAEPLPWYYDGEMPPLPGMENLTQGMAGLRERTPKTGPMDAMQPGGSAAAGPSGNPDVPPPGGNASWVPGSIGWLQHHRTAEPLGGGFDPRNPIQEEVLPARPPSDWHMPGSGGNLAPPQAPPTEHGDYAGSSGQADRRLGNMWGSQEYYGAKPGNQVGSRFIDDNRDYSHPLPQLPPVGGKVGPPGYTGPQPLPAYWPPKPHIPWPDFGPDPQLGNVDSKSDKGQGNTKDGGGRKGSKEKTQQSQASNSGADKPQHENVGPERPHQNVGPEKPKAKDPNAPDDPLQNAMDKQQGPLIESMSPFEGDPTGSEARELADQVIPGGGMLFDKANQLTHGGLARSVDSLPRGVLEVVGTASFLNDVLPAAGLLKTEAKVGAKVGAEVLEDAAEDIGAKQAAKQAGNVGAKNTGNVVKGAGNAGTVPRVMLEEGKQGKHIPGHNNYIDTRSPFTHPNPQDLLDRFIGKGDPVGKVPRGKPGFKERVDFGEVIGEFEGKPTTRGIIHNSKNGAHIVPSAPVE